MAVFNGIEGQARVEVESDGANWQGHILVEPDPGNLRYFDIAGPTSRVIYEGPVLANGKYLFANGTVQITSVELGSEALKVEFRGMDRLNVAKTLSGQPPDFLS